MTDTGHEVKIVLGIWPVHSGGTKQGTGAIVVESTIHLDVPGERGMESLSRRSYPVQNWALQTLSVIGSGTRYTFLDLQER